MRTIHLLKSLLPALALLLATGCNGDVFIDEFLPEAPAPARLTEDANEATISFEADNWDVWSIEGGYEYSICDEAGNGLSLPLENGGKNYQIFCQGDYVDFRLEKCDGRTLKLHLYEQLYDEPWQWTIWVGNRYEQQPVYVTLYPTGKYQVDSIVYDWSRFDFYDYELKEVDWVIVLNKNGTDPVSWTCHPFQKSKREVSFYGPSNSSGYYPLDKEQIARRLGRCSVPIPDTKDGKPILAGTQAVFGSLEQEMDVPLLDKDLAVKVPIDAGKDIRITVFNNLDCYHVPFTLYASQPRTGKRLEMPGTLYSKCPVDYMIIKQDVTDEQQP